MTEEVVIMRGHVVVGVDGSPAADNAVDWAADEAVLRGAALEVLHAWEWTAYEASDWYGHHLYNDATEITQVAAERAMRRRPELTVHTSIVHGSAGQVLADAGERAQLTVLGSRGRGGFADLLLGSVGHEVAARGTGPLLVVRADKAFAAPPPHGEESPTPNATRVTVGIADETSLLAVEAALAEAARRRWSVYAVHAWSFPDVPAFGAATTGSAPYADAVRECQQYGESIVANTVATARDRHKELVHDVHEARAKADAETAGELMTSPAIGIAPDASVVDAARLMERHSVKRLPVVDGAGRLRGIVSRGDLLRVFLRTDERIRGEILEDLLRRDLWVDPESITVHVHDGVVELTGEMEHKTLARILVRMCRGVDGVVRVHDHLTWALDDTKVHPTELPQLHGRGGWGRD